MSLVPWSLSYSPRSRGTCSRQFPVNRLRNWNPKSLVRMSPVAIFTSATNDNNEFKNSDESEGMSSVSLSTAKRRARISGVSVKATTEATTEISPEATHNNSFEAGFWMFLQVASANASTTAVERLLAPVRLTDSSSNPSEDATSATSPEALTILQLLAGVDMATPVLSPELLAQIVVSFCEVEHFAKRNADEPAADDSSAIIASIIAESIQKQYRRIVQPIDGQDSSQPTFRYFFDQDDHNNHKEVSQTGQRQQQWIRSKIQLPIVTLDELQIEFLPTQPSQPSQIKYTLSCSIRSESAVSGEPPKRLPYRKDVVLTTEAPLQQQSHELLNTSTNRISHGILRQFCYSYFPTVTASFVALALSLRYKAPITILLPSSQTSQGQPPMPVHPHLVLSQAELLTHFPLYRSVEMLQRTSAAVDQNIERGFQYTQLEAALRIATERNDRMAVLKIQERLVQLTTSSIRDNIPVQADTDTDAMQ